MKTYTLALSTNISTNNQNISLIDKTNLASVRWFINWGQFFKYEDYNKRCKIKTRFVTKKSTTITHDGNLGFLSVSLPSTNCNMLNGSVLGQTLVHPAEASTTNFYIKADTLQESGLESLIPSQSGELIVNLININGEAQTNIMDYIISLVFEVNDEDSD